MHKRYALSAAAAALAVLFRQTNAVWAAFILLVGILSSSSKTLKITQIYGPAATDTYELLSQTLIDSALYALCPRPTFAPFWVVMYNFILLMSDSAAQASILQRFFEHNHRQVQQSGLAKQVVSTIKLGWLVRCSRCRQQPGI